MQNILITQPTQQILENGENISIEKRKIKKGMEIKLALVNGPPERAGAPLISHLYMAGSPLCEGFQLSL